MWGRGLSLSICKAGSGHQAVSLDGLSVMEGRCLAWCSESLSVPTCGKKWPFLVVMDYVIFLIQEFQKELSQWRKDPSGSKKKPKYSYKTVEELKAKGRISKKLSAPQKEISQVKVWGAHGHLVQDGGLQDTHTVNHSSISHPTLAHKVPVGLLGRLSCVSCFLAWQ